MNPTGLEYKQRATDFMYNDALYDTKLNWIPLYTHPVKELTEDMLWEFAEKFLDTDAPWGEANVTGIGHFIEAILRKAQEK